MTDPLPRRRSASVSVGLLGALALSLTGCGHSHSDNRRCVNNQDVVVDNRNCSSTGTGSHWYYGGAGGRSIGSQASGGSNTDTTKGVSRGGLGDSGGSSKGSSGS